METQNNNSIEYSIHGDDKKKKKGKGSGARHVFRVALYMMRRKRNNQPSSKSNLHPNIWRRIVGSIRPLHSTEIPTTPPPQAKITKTPSSKTTTVEEEEEEEEVFTPHVSPIPSSSSTAGTSSVGTDSRYASALNLKEMDQSDGDDDGGGGRGGDDMIDAKAEEFIARFYTQMKMQNQERR